MDELFGGWMNGVFVGWWIFGRVDGLMEGYLGG